MPMWSVKSLKEELEARNYKDDDLLLLTFWHESFIFEYTECSVEEFDDVIQAGDDAMDEAIARVNDAMTEHLEQVREESEEV